MNDNKYIVELLKVRSVSAGKAVEIIDTLLEIETIKKNITTNYSSVNEVRRNSLLKGLSHFSILFTLCYMTWRLTE